MAAVCKECRTGSRGSKYKQLRTAAESGHDDCVKALIEKGADVNNQDEGGHTALMLASRKGHDGCANILIEAGADVNLTAKNNFTALMYAVYKEYNMIESDQEGRDRCVKALIEAGADLEIRARTSEFTALMRAVCEGQTEGVKLLIKAGADINKHDDLDGQTALMWAANEGADEILSILIEAGGDVNEGRTKDGQTPLMLAALEGRVNTVKLLLQARADVNKQDRYGYTALWCFEHIDCMRLLLAAGANINMLDRENHNALQYYILEWPLDKTMVMLLYAAGKTTGGNSVKRANGTKEVPIPDYLLLEDLKLNLKHLCREAIRKHLINLDPHQHLFGRIPQLGLPDPVTAYLLYKVSLDEEQQQT